MTEPALPSGWGGLKPATRRIIRATVTWVVSGIIAAVFGVLTANYTGSVGPHIAQYSTTLNDEITFGMGPLGSLIIDSPLPLHLGVDIQIEQIPDELTLDSGAQISAGPDEAVAALTADLASYTQFFSDPAEAIALATKGLVSDALARTILVWSILLTVVLLGRLAAHGVLRAAAASAWRRPGVAPVTVVLGLIAIVLPIVPATQGSSGAGSVSSVLAGTPLQDARITGRLGALVDHYGQVVIDEIDKNVEFYDAVVEGVNAAFDADPAPSAPIAPPLAMPTVSPPQDPETPGGEEGEGASPDDAGVQGAGDPGGKQEDLSEPVSGLTSTPTTEAKAAQDPMTIVVVSDLHCNIGMARVAGIVAERVDASLILDLGDDVIGGTSVEGFCITSFADSFAGIPVVVAPGNHDSQETADQQRKQGWHVLSGEVIEVAGLRFLGDEDPTLTSLGAPTQLVADETIPERGHRLADLACAQDDADRRVDIFMMHNPRATEEVLKRGCVDQAFAGHFHRRIGPWQRGLGVQYLHTSSAGATLNKPTIGPLNGTAGISIITWDKANREPMAMRVLRAMPDTSVELSPWYAWPELPQEPVHVDWPTPENSPWP